MVDFKLRFAVIELFESAAGADLLGLSKNQP